MKNNADRIPCTIFVFMQVAVDLIISAYMSPYLTIWAENVAFVYDTTTAEWLQTIPLKRVKPLCRDGSIGLSYVSDIPRLVYFRNIYHGEFDCI